MDILMFTRKYGFDFELIHPNRTCTSLINPVQGRVKLPKMDVAT